MICIFTRKEAMNKISLGFALLLCCQLTLAYEMKLVNNTDYTVEAAFLLLGTKDHVESVAPQSTKIYKSGAWVPQGIKVGVTLLTKTSRTYDVGPETITLQESWGPFSTKLGKHTWILSEEKNKDNSAARLILTRESTQGKKEFEKASDWNL